MSQTSNHAEKYFYQVFPERVNSLIEDPQLLSVWRTFGRGVFRRSAVLEGLDAFVRANQFSGRRCVEIGTCNGLPAIVLARYFDEVVSIDIAPSELKHQIADFLGVTNVRFIDVKDNAEKARVISDLEFDAAFSDGDHAKDAEEDFRLVARCGRVLMHEYWEAQPPVWNLVNRLKIRDRVVTSGKWALWDGGA